MYVMENGFVRCRRRKHCRLWRCRHHGPYCSKNIRTARVYYIESIWIILLFPLKMQCRRKNLCISIVGIANFNSTETMRIFWRDISNWYVHIYDLYDICINLFLSSLIRFIWSIIPAKYRELISCSPVHCCVVRRFRRLKTTIQWMINSNWLLYANNAKNIRTEYVEKRVEKR